MSKYLLKCAINREELYKKSPYEQYINSYFMCSNCLKKYKYQLPIINSKQVYGKEDLGIAECEVYRCKRKAYDLVFLAGEYRL